jgi:large subunit ribosomal protein L1
MSGKKYEESAKLVDESKTYAPEEAISLMKKAAHAKFDETVQLHIRTNLDPRNATQQIRGIALLPHGLGKTVRVLVFAQGDAGRAAEAAGADVVGGDDLIQKIDGGWVEFDVAIATPDMMAKVGKLGKVLGRKGLMPNPKSGTVVNASDLGKAISDARKGRVEFKLDKTAIIHVPLGKVSFEEAKLNENLAAIIEAVMKAKPSGAKGQFVKTASINSTMGPGVHLDLKTTLIMTGNV